MVTAYDDFLDRRGGSPCAAAQGQKELEALENQLLDTHKRGESSSQT